MIQAVVASSEINEGTLAGTEEGQVPIKVVTLTVDALTVGEIMEPVRIQLAMSSSIAAQIAGNLKRKAKQVPNPADQHPEASTLPASEVTEETITPI